MWGVCFLVVALASIGLTLWVSWKLEGGAAAVNEAGRLRMNMLRMVIAQQTEAPASLEALVGKFDSSLELLHTGNPARPLFVPWSDETRTRFEQIRKEWSLLRQDWASQPMPSNTTAVARADGFIRLVDDFVNAIEAQIARWTSALHLFQLGLMALAIAAAAAFVAISYMLVLNPVTRLQQAQARMRQGELGTRLPVDSVDEFGQLSAGFNLMAHALQTSHEELEHKVREKTASLAVNNERLAALYETSAHASDAGTLEALTQGFVQQIRRVAKASAAAVRWSDETNERYVLLAADGLPPAMAEAEHCLHTGTCLCGQSHETARIRVIPITPVSTKLPHCHASGFKTVVTIPIEIHQRILGEVDLFFRTPVELSSGMQDLLATMTRHLSSSMESLRVAALEREAMVAEERRLLARELHDSIAQSLAFLKIQVQLLRDAIARNDLKARDRSMGELDTGVRECYSDVRELLVHFRTRTSEEDIEPALRTTLSKFEHQTSMETLLSMSGHGLPLDPDIQIQVLHIVQEALSNVRKHSGASMVELRVQRHPHWCFEVKDNGVGFRTADVPPDSLHVGLGIMRERAMHIGASLHVVSAPGQGTCVRIELPATPVQSQAAIAAESALL